MSSNIDEQLAKAKARVKRLEQRKMLSDAKKAIVEVQQLKDSKAWTRGAIQNLIKDIEAHKLGNYVVNVGEQNQKKFVSSNDLIIQRLNGILKGEQPTQKK